MMRMKNILIFILAFSSYFFLKSDNNFQTLQYQFDELQESLRSLSTHLFSLTHPLEYAMGNLLDDLSPLKMPDTIEEPFQEISQIRVYGQNSVNGGGGLSCGYHALKNSILLLRALQNEPERKNDIDQLNEQDLVVRLFNRTAPYGYWRQIVVARRLKVKAANKLAQILKKTLIGIAEQNMRIIFNPLPDDFEKDTPFNPLKMREKYTKIFVDIAQILISRNKNKIQQADLIETIQNVPIIISEEPEELNPYFKNNMLPGLYSSATKAIKAIQEYMTDPSTIQKYIPSLDSIDITIVQQEPSSNSLGSIKFTVSGEEIIIADNGENLIDKDIDCLIKKEQETKGLLDNISSDFFTVFTPSDLETAQIVFFKEMISLDTIKEKIKNHEAFCHFFILCSGSQLSSAPLRTLALGTNHWVALALFNMPEKSSYVITDSLNSSRISPTKTIDYVPIKLTLKYLNPENS